MGCKRRFKDEEILAGFIVTPLITMDRSHIIYNQNLLPEESQTPQQALHETKILRHTSNGDACADYSPEQ